MIKKFSIYIITILSISIVVFNNLAGLLEKIFSPNFNLYLGMGFGGIVLGVITYAVVNREFLGISQDT